LTENSPECSCDVGGAVQANQSDIEYAVYGWVKQNTDPGHYGDFITLVRLSEYSNLDGVDVNIGARTIFIQSEQYWIQFAYYDLIPENWNRYINYDSSYNVLSEWCFYYMGYSLGQASLSQFAYFSD
jgi:hypothetical protein